MGHGDEIVLQFDLPRLNEQSIWNVGFKRVGHGFFYFRVHAFNWHAISEILDGHRIALGYQVQSGSTYLLVSNAFNGTTLSDVNFNRRLKPKTMGSTAGFSLAFIFRRNSAAGIGLER